MWRLLPWCLGAVVLFGYGAISKADMLVWSATATVKVRAQEYPERTPSGISISAARNEYESFQIVVRSQGRPLLGLDVDLSNFESADHRRISCLENCTIYREVFMNVVQPSGPYGMVGEWPDALIPKTDRYAGEKRNAFPYDVAQERNQPVWIEVYVPPATASGIYTAVVTVRAQGEQPVRIPVYLRVWDFTLSSTSSIKNAFLLWTGGLPNAHGSEFTGEALDELARTYSKAMLAHRLSNGWLIGGDDWQPASLRDSRVDLGKLQRDFGPFFDGSVLPNGAQTTALVPTSALCLGTARDPSTITSTTMCRPEVINFLDATGWLGVLAYYLPDEPNLADANAVQQVRSFADAIHQRDNRLKTLLTKNYSDLLQPHTDIWVAPLPALQESFDNGTYWSTYATEIARGKQVWLYQACFEHTSACGFQTLYPRQSGWPDYMIDMQGMKNRMGDWVNWKLRVQGELYWGVNYAYYLSDPFQDQVIAGGNGDGTFFYPGTPERIGGKTHIPIESIRLKLKREGLEDYEYLSLLARTGNADFADQIVDQLVKSAHDWEQDPQVLYRLRERMAEKLQTLRASPAGRLPGEIAPIRSEPEPYSSAWRTKGRGTRPVWTKAATAW